MVPSSCHGVVLAAGNGKCQEMLSLRIVVRPGTSARDTPAISTKRSMSDRMVSGVTRRTATLDFIDAGLLFSVLLFSAGDLRLQHHRLVGVLLDDGQQPRVEEADLEEDEERQRAVDLVGQRVEHGPGE